jgi:peptidoglycan/LPS O-acetylase OafA/YrhL
LRLLFASLVIIGHAPELLDRSRTREPLTALFHTLSLGELAVDGFFLLSGFLITRSFQNSRSAGDYLWRRILRIYPAYIVAYLAAILVLVPLTGGSCRGTAGQTAFNLVFLQAPGYCPGQLRGIRHLNVLNGAMWTIAYEFRCYLLTLLLGVCGLLGRRKLMLALAAGAVVVSILTRYPTQPYPITDSMAHVEQWPLVQAFNFNFVLTLRLGAVYLSGTCFALFWREIEAWLNGWTAAACGIAAAAALGSMLFAEAGLTIFGGAALFWLALKARLGRLQRVNASATASISTAGRWRRISAGARRISRPGCWRRWRWRSPPRWGRRAGGGGAVCETAAAGAGAPRGGSVATNRKPPPCRHDGGSRVAAD